MKTVINVILFIMMATSAWGVQCNDIKKNNHCINYDNTQVSTILGVDKVHVMTTQTYHSINETLLSTIQQARFHKKQPCTANSRY